MGLNDIRNYIIGTILFSIIIFGGVLMIGSFRNANPSLDNTQLESFNKSLSLSSNVTTAVNDIESSIDSTNTNSGALGWLNALLGTVWNGLKTIKGTMSFVNVAIKETGTMFGVPESMTGLIILIPILIIIFAIWVAIIKTSE